MKIKQLLLILLLTGFSSCSKEEVPDDENTPVETGNDVRFEITIGIKSIGLETLNETFVYEYYNGSVKEKNARRGNLTIENAGLVNVPQSSHTEIDFLVKNLSMNPNVNPDFKLFGSDLPSIPEGFDVLSGKNIPVDLSKGLKFTAEDNNEYSLRFSVDYFYIPAEETDILKKFSFTLSAFQQDIFNYELSYHNAAQVLAYTLDLFLPDGTQKSLLMESFSDENFIIWFIHEYGISACPQILADLRLKIKNDLPAPAFQNLYLAPIMFEDDPSVLFEYKGDGGDAVKAKFGDVEYVFQRYADESGPQFRMSFPCNQASTQVAMGEIGVIHSQGNKVMPVAVIPVNVGTEVLFNQ